MRTDESGIAEREFSGDSVTLSEGKKANYSREADSYRHPERDGENLVRS